MHSLRECTPIGDYFYINGTTVLMLHKIVLESGNCDLKVEWFQEKGHVTCSGNVQQKRKCNSFHIVLYV